MAVAEPQVRDVFRRAAGLQIAVLIRKARDGVGVANVDPLRIGSRRVEIDAKWAIQAGDENFRLLGLALGGDSAENAEVAGAAVCNEKIAIGLGPTQGGLIQAAGTP